jgi:hypothetical protein
VTRLVIVIYDAGADDDVMEVLDQPPVQGWTKLFHAFGAGGTGVKMSDPAFPGMNNILLVALPDEDVELLRQRLRDVQRLFSKKPGITIYSLPMEVL